MTVAGMLSWNEADQTQAPRLPNLAAPRLPMPGEVDQLVPVDRRDADHGVRAVDIV